VVVVVVLHGSDHSRHRRWTNMSYSHINQQSYDFFSYRNAILLSTLRGLEWYTGDWNSIQSGYSVSGSYKNQYTVSVHFKFQMHL